MCYKRLNGYIVHILLLLILLQTSVQLDLSLGQFPGGSDGKGSTCNAGDLSLQYHSSAMSACWTQRSIMGYGNK